MNTAAHDKRTLLNFLVPAVFCALSLLVPLTRLTISALRPVSQPFPTWFGRSGSIMCVFALIAQYKIGLFEQGIRGTAFAESWAIHRRYAKRIALVNRASLALAILGTLVWGYGDLLS